MKGLHLRESEYSMPYFDRITFNPNILGGKACIRGMRIPVSLVINLVANGMSNDEIMAEYPDLDAADIQASLRYAAWTTEDSIFRPERMAA